MKPSTRETIKRKLKIIGLCAMLICTYSISNGQYYGPGSFRRRPANNPPPEEKKDEGNPEPSGYMSVNFGFANPEGSFSNAFSTGYGGYAQPGTVFHFSLGIPISHSNFGLAFMYGSYNNNYDINTYSRINNVAPIYTGNNYYSISSIMGGLFVTYPMGRFSFDGRLMIGALLCTLPEQAYGYYDTAGNTYTSDIPQSNSTAFAYDAGVGVRFLIVKLGRRPLCAMVNLDYLGASVPYSTEQVEDYTPVLNNPNGLTYEVDIPVSGHIPVSLLNLTFGLGYQLGK